MTQSLDQVTIMTEPTHGSDWYAALVQSRVRQYIDTWPPNWQSAMAPGDKTYEVIMRIRGHKIDPDREPLPTAQSNTKADLP